MYSDTLFYLLQSQSTMMFTEGMISLEANSSAVFFPPTPRQAEVHGGTKILLEGLRSTVVLQRGAAVVQTERLVQYANKDYVDMCRRGDEARVPLLDARRNTIAGVQIPHVGQEVTDESTRARIEEAIRKMLINVEFKSKKPGKGDYFCDMFPDGPQVLWNIPELTVPAACPLCSRKMDAVQEQGMHKGDGP